MIRVISQVKLDWIPAKEINTNIDCAAIVSQWFNIHLYSYSCSYLRFPNVWKTSDLGPAKRTKFNEVLDVFTKNFTNISSNLNDGFIWKINFLNILNFQHSHCQPSVRTSQKRLVPNTVSYKKTSCQYYMNANRHCVFCVYL